MPGGENLPGGLRPPCACVFCFAMGQALTSCRVLLIATLAGVMNVSCRDYTCAETATCPIVDAGVSTSTFNASSGPLDTRAAQPGSTLDAASVTPPNTGAPTGNEQPTDSGDRAAGESCQTDDQCAQGNCVDGVCCTSSCAEVCGACNQPGSEGDCVELAWDELCGEPACPANAECRTHEPVERRNCAGVGTCLLESTCDEFVKAGEPCRDGEGTCGEDGQCLVPTKRILGDECAADEECGSGACVAATDGATRCCESECDDICSACSVDGWCDAVPDDDERCSEVSCPESSLCERFPPTLIEGRCAALGRCFDRATYCEPEYEDQGAECGLGLACDGDGSCVSVCRASETWCGSCIDTQSSNLHCGGCNQPCEPGEVCSSGSCEVDCAAGQLACGDACINPQTNNKHCGASGDCSGDEVGVPCTSPASCIDGTCQLVCGGGQINCNNSCINPNSDEGFCGASGNCVAPNNGTPCDSGYSCEAGVCRQQCPPGQVSCDGRCLDPSSDEANCGATLHCQNRGDDCTESEQCISGTCRLPNGSNCVSNSDCVTGICSTFYFDADGDTYASASSGTLRVCGNSPPSSRYKADDLDCCDIAGSVEAVQTNPAYSGGFTSDATPCGHYDWDCDNVETRRYLTGTCSDFTTQATCQSVFEGEATVACGATARLRACAWISNACTLVQNASTEQPCH